MNKTNPTAPCSVNNIRRTFPTMLSCSGTVANVQPARKGGYFDWFRVVIVRNSDSACARVVSGLIRATRLRKYAR